MLSIITVCYNSERTIKDAIESVLWQETENIEYILIDGNSKDNTVSIIKSYEEAFKESGKKFIWKSESDKGIYDAMNKGIEMASGEWIYFLGSDDTLYSKDVMKKILEANDYSESDIIVGKVKTVPKNWNINLPKKISKFKLFLKPSACHQSIIAKKYTLTNKFSQEYKLASDLLWLIECIEKKYKILAISNIIAYYSLNGESTLNNKVYYEIMEITRKKIGYIPYLIRKMWWKIKRII